MNTLLKVTFYKSLSKTLYLKQLLHSDPKKKKATSTKRFFLNILFKQFIQNLRRNF